MLTRKVFLKICFAIMPLIGVGVGAFTKDKKRKVEVWVKDVTVINANGNSYDVRKWEEIHLKDAKKGMLMRMHEPHGKRVMMDQEGNFEAITISDAYLNKNKIWTVNVSQEV